MVKFLLFGAVFAAGVLTLNAGSFSADLTAFNKVLERSWKKNGVTPAPLTEDAAFYRRLSLRVLGKLPAPAEVENFIKSKDPDKRQKLIDTFLSRTDFAMMLAMRYADMFRIKSEFPINLWPNAVQCYHRYFYQLTCEDRSWRQTAEELLLSSGSNFRIAPANFFRANADRTPKGLAAGTALALMNFRTDAMSKEHQELFAAFFSRIRFKSTKEWKEEIVYSDPAPAILKCRTPDGKEFTIDTAKNDPRKVFADWLCDKENPILSRAYVNRAWYWMTGVGLANPADDMALPQSFWERFTGKAAPANAPADESVMEFLVEYFEKNNCSTKALYRLILNSRAWQADWRCKSEELAKKEKFLAVYPVRRLESEIITDALSSLTGSYERFVSVIPEPFTFLPKNAPAVTIADGSISSRTLDNFGKPSRDAGTLAERNNTMTPSQRLFLLNSNWIYQRTNTLPWRVFPKRRMTDAQRVERLYLVILSRKPTAGEIKKVEAYQKKLPRKERWRTWTDLAWALINTREFLHHH